MCKFLKLQKLDQDAIHVCGDNPRELIEIAIKDDSGDPVIITTTVPAFRMLERAIHEHVYPHYQQPVIAAEAACDVSPMDPSLDEK